jgi:hypothetical protein
MTSKPEVNFPIADNPLTEEMIWYVPEFPYQRPGLFLQLRSKVADHRGRLTALLRRPVKQDSLIIWRQIVEVLWGRPVGDNGCGCAELQRASAFFHRGHKKTVTIGKIKELLAVSAPMRQRSACRRNLEFSLSTTKCHHVTLVYSRISGFPPSIDEKPNFTQNASARVSSMNRLPIPDRKRGFPACFDPLIEWSSLGCCDQEKA